VVDRNVDWTLEINLFKAALEVCPDSVKALNNHGMFAMSSGDYAGAIASLERGIYMYPYSHSFYVNAGIAHHRSGNYVRAAWYFERSLGMHRTKSVMDDVMDAILYESRTFRYHNISSGGSSSSSGSSREVYFDSGMIHFNTTTTTPTITTPTTTPSSGIYGHASVPAVVDPKTSGYYGMLLNDWYVASSAGGAPSGLAPVPGHQRLSDPGRWSVCACVYV
jgi:hypothetical protein